MVVFYELGSDGKPTVPVLYLDTLKVSTIEQTAESTEARGGKGNAALISWDYNKEINVTLEDALFSAKSMAIMFGNGRVKAYNGDEAYIMRTEKFRSTADGTLPSETDAGQVGWTGTYTAPDGRVYKKINPKFYTATGEVATSIVADADYFCSYDLLADGAVIEISANSFPGTYYVTGDKNRANCLLVA